MALSLKEKGAAFLGLVSEVSFVVFPQFVGSMGELAPRIVRTESRVHELFAQFQLLFPGVVSDMSGRCLAVVVRTVRVVSGRGLLES